jgi:hypothetical protein
MKLLKTLLTMESDVPESEADLVNPLKYSYEQYESESSYSSDYSSDEPLDTIDPVQDMSVDELLLYINGGESNSPKSSKKSRRKRKK